MKYLTFLLIIIPALCFSQGNSIQTSTGNSLSNIDFVTAAIQAELSPDDVLKELKAGNDRYKAGVPADFNQRKASKIASIDGQFPYAMIINCIDSRSVPEIVFNQPVGAMFVSRTAAPVVGPVTIGGMEFASVHSGTKLILVMGHSQCGAIIGACAGVDTPSNLDHLLQKIQPAVKQTAMDRNDPLDCNDHQVIDQIARANVLNQMEAIYDQSPALSDLAAQGSIRIVGAMHNINTGDVNFFDKNGMPLNLND
ncbi:MAG: carbonic anhydrase [Lentimicrobiaceae bacterium]|jgi:carbonic anhydrase|nr:carbonic anhydrase [Lentimicrobiaceae bacterium]|tara:strand:- start:40092 stop:40850 length:759 start_codon:yes stop_codon:yes gene_type:complete